MYYIIGLMVIVANGQMLKNNLTIWSHCKSFALNRLNKQKYFFPEIQRMDDTKSKIKTHSEMNLYQDTLWLCIV